MPTYLNDGHVRNSSNSHFNSVVNYGKDEREPLYSILLFFTVGTSFQR